MTAMPHARKRGADYNSATIRDRRNGTCRIIAEKLMQTSLEKDLGSVRYARVRRLKWNLPDTRLIGRRLLECNARAHTARRATEIADNGSEVLAQSACGSHSHNCDAISHSHPLRASSR
jgi:hypothetical protein